MRKLIVEQTAQEDLFHWAKTDPKHLRKIIQLIEDTQKNPFSGLGKPEALKHELKGFWSRRISDEHRLVYMVTDDPCSSFSAATIIRRKVSQTPISPAPT